MSTIRRFNYFKMVRDFSILAVVIGSILYMAQNCGRSEEISGLATLDNFAAGKNVFVNQCSAPADARFRKPVAAAMAKLLVLDRDHKHPLTIAAHDTLSAVPDELLMWAMKHYGTLIVSEDAAKLCNAAIISGDGARKDFDLDALKGCFVYYPKTSKTREILNFNISNNISDIQHTLLKIYGSAIAQLAPELSPEIYPTLLAFQKNIARAFIADLADPSQSAFKVDTLSNFLGKYNSKDLRESVASLGQGRRLESDPLEVFSFSDSEASKRYDNYAFNKKRFLDFTFAEAFDSYFCNNWGSFDEGLATRIRDGSASLAEASGMLNTRRRMQVFFPKTFRVFESGIGRVLSGLNRSSRLVESSQSGLSLQGGRRRSVRPSKTVRYDSPAWSGTKAFFGSLWNNTGGAAGRSYGRYTERVERSVNEHYERGGKGIGGAILSGVGGGVAKSYEEGVAQPIREQTTQRFDTQVRVGATANEAAYNAVALAVGDQIGSTPFLEGVYGVDTTQGEFISDRERLKRGFQGTVQLLDTATGVGGFVGAAKNGARSAAANSSRRAATRELRENLVDPSNFNGARPGTGLWKAQDTAVGGTNAVKATREAFEDASRRGLTSDVDGFLNQKYSNGQTRLESYAAGHAEDAATTTLKKGDRLYVVQDAADPTDLDRLVWGADKPPHPDVVNSRDAYLGFVEETALPPLKGDVPRSQARVLEVEVTADVVPAVSSTVQPNYGKVGGAQQTFLAYNKSNTPGSNLFKVVGDTADASRPIGVYQQYNKFNNAVDNLASAQQRASAANRIFDNSASQTIRNWGTLGVAQQAYQGVGSQLGQPSSNAQQGAVSSTSVFNDPVGTRPDVLSAPFSRQIPVSTPN